MDNLVDTLQKCRGACQNRSEANRSLVVWFDLGGWIDVHDLQDRGSKFRGMADLYITPWKTNMEPETGGLEDDFPFQTGDFQIPC